ncbi:MAG: hypothetical protein L0387_01245 [Acidobacteria bacterium]|nr:hypothetical protein [Acidobacteriota bacterium]
MSEPTRIRIVEDPEQPAEREVLADAIVKLSKAAEALNQRSGLNQRAIVVLLHDHSRVPKRDIEAVLRAMQQLERDYCRRT